MHDVLTIAPALAAELEGVPAATLVPHLYPGPSPGLPPYGLGARPARTPVGRALWRALERPLELGFARGRSELNETRARLGLPPVTRRLGGISDRSAAFRDPGVGTLMITPMAFSVEDRIDELRAIAEPAA